MKLVVKEVNKIKGEINISGSKNAVLPIIAASLLTEEETVLYNVPIIDDVIIMIKILSTIGVETTLDRKKHKLTINARKLKNKVLTKDVTKIRASYYLMGSMISRKNNILIEYPGGCNFTSRPIELHLSAFKQMNIEIEMNKYIKLEKNKRKDIEITFPKISVGATINTILASVLSNNTTIIKNISIEPEVLDVINFLNHMGSNITYIGDRQIKIEGVKKLHGIKYQIMFDRIETGSYLLLTSSIPNSMITLNKVKYKYMKSIIDVIHQIGCKTKITKTKIYMCSPPKVKGIKLNITPYPGFPTDLQPILCSALLTADSKSIIKDKVYTDRISHISELNKIGGNIVYINNEIHIFPSNIISSNITSKDLRCAFALLIGGCLSKGKTIISDIDYIYRGYDNIEEKLKKIGVFETYLF